MEDWELSSYTLEKSENYFYDFLNFYRYIIIYWKILN